MNRLARQSLLLASVTLLALPAVVHAQFILSTNNGQITIRGGYLDSGGGICIPSTIDGLPITSIGTYAFRACTSLTTVAIADGITSISSWAFGECTSLNSVTNIGCLAFACCTCLPGIGVSVSNPAYCSVEGVLFDKSMTTLIRYPIGKPGSIYDIRTNVASIGDYAFFPCQRLTNVTFPNSVTNIGHFAFYCCKGLKSVTIPASVTSIGNHAFSACTNLTSVYFKGNAPSFGGDDVFAGADKVKIYHLPETTGWSNTFGGRPTAIWKPADECPDGGRGEMKASAGGAR